MKKTKDQACPRIYTRCPACHNDTLTVNNGHLLCTWHECKDPTLIDRISELVRAGDRFAANGGPPEQLKALVSARCSAACVERERSLLLLLKEISAVISYQPEFPMAHKMDIAAALKRFEDASAAAWQQNARTQTRRADDARLG